MARRLIAAGHQVTVWNRTSERTAPVVSAGGRSAASPADAVRDAEVAISMLADFEALESAIGGPEGAGRALERGATYIEMSTIGPDALAQIRTLLPDSVAVLDAPVLGSVPQAESGELRIFVGGTPATYESVRDLLGVLGTPRYAGGPGSGAALKLAVNAALVNVMAALGESMALGDALGIPSELLLDVLEDSPIGATVRSKRELIEHGLYPARFRLALALKDARLALRAAGRRGVGLRLTPDSAAWLEDAAAAGLADRDYSAVIDLIRGRFP